jgi:hypothetical protein
MNNAISLRSECQQSSRSLMHISGVFYEQVIHVKGFSVFFPGVLVSRAVPL